MKRKQDTQDVSDDQEIKKSSDVEAEGSQPHKKHKGEASASTSPNETGMTDEHVQIFQKFSTQNEVITVWRPINENAAQSLQQGAMGKTISTKAKSSNFSPIAASIPFDVRLSKIAKEKDNDKIAYAQKINDQVLEESEAIYQKWEGNINSDTADKFNALNLTTTIVKEDEHGREIGILLDNEGQIIMESDNETPTFIAWDKKTNKIYFYDTGEKAFSKEGMSIPTEARIEPVKVIAYRYFSVKTGMETIRPITADYDELVSAPRKIFPLHNNIVLTNDGKQKVLSEETVKIPTVYSEEFHSQLMSDEPINKRDVAVQQILHYENHLKKQHRTSEYLYRQTMGAVNEWQLNAKAYQKLETEGATNHGPEVNNPYPEPLNPDKYAAFLPESGSQEILRTEQSICNFINRWRAQGFPLDVNPKWGWEIDDQGVLSVPQVKFDWNTVHQGFKDLKDRIHQLELYQGDILNELGLANITKNIIRLQNLQELTQRVTVEEDTERLKVGIEDTKKALELATKEAKLVIPDENSLSDLVLNKEEIVKLKARLKAEEAIIEKKVEIERRRLEPSIVYSDFLSWEKDNYYDYKLEKMFLKNTNTALSAEKTVKKRLQEYQSRNSEIFKEVEQQIEKEREFNKNVIVDVKRRERDNQQEEVNQFESQLEDLFEQYGKDFSGDISLINKEKDRVIDEKNKMTSEIVEIKEIQQTEQVSQVAIAPTSPTRTKFSVFSTPTPRVETHEPASAVTHKNPSPSYGSSDEDS